MAWGMSFEIKLISIVGLAACSSAGADDATATARLNDLVPSVAVVSWSSPSAARVRVEYGPDTRYGFTTPRTELAAKAHEIDVIGFPASSELHFRVVVSTEAGDVAGDDHTLATNPEPAGLPSFELLHTDGEAWGSWTLVAYEQPGTDVSGVAVLDADAQPIWYWLDDRGSVPWATMSADRSEVVFLVDNHRFMETGPSFNVLSLDGRTYETIPAPWAHHAVAQPDVAGVRFAYIAADFREWNGEVVVGDGIVEVADDGSAREVWNAFDHLDVVVHEGWNSGSYDDGADWTHANGLFYDGDEGAYYLSLYYLGTVVKIDRATGDTVWQLGGADSDFTFVNDRGFSHQHAPEVRGDELYVFDNGAGGEPSRAVGYTLDTDAWTATRIWAWETAEESRAAVLGDVDLLPGDQFLSAWGDVGQVNVTGHDGTLHLSMDVDPGVIIGKAARLDTLYP